MSGSAENGPIADYDAERFQHLVENNLRLGAAIDLALEASYWDRPYDTRIEAIRKALHEACGERVLPPVGGRVS